MRLVVAAMIAPTLLGPVWGRVPAHPSDCRFAGVLPEALLAAGWQVCCSATSAATLELGGVGVSVVGGAVVGGAVVGGGGRSAHEQ
jgi:hypothetical protein